MVRLHCRGEKYKLDNGVKPRPVADDLLYNSGNSYAIPLLLYKVELGSAIHPEHMPVFQEPNYKAQLHFWQQQGFQMSIDELMDFDPYLGRLSEPSGAKT